MIKIIVNKMISTIKLIQFKKTWRKQNAHNFTYASRIFPIEKVEVGDKTYGPLNVVSYGNCDEKLKIGSYCSIAPDVKFLLGGEHSYKRFSTYPFKQYVCKINEDTLSKGPIIIKDDVWIGERCLILSGVTINQGAVIGAGSVVAKDIPPYAIYAGSKIIRYRFSEDVIEKLKKFSFKNLNDEIILENIDYLYKELDNEVINNFIIK
jgi:acetyltransferase-like isoleucine patch superfamily enzyme